MIRHLLLVQAILLCGCWNSSQIEEESPQPAQKVATNFDRLPGILAGADNSEVVLYEGLPSQFWEPQLRESEIRQKLTVEFHGYRFYEEVLILEDADSKTLSGLICSAGSYRSYRGGKRCSDFHPDFCLEWTSSEGTTHAMISLECGEIMLFGPKEELHCDFIPDMAKEIREILRGYVNQRPKTEASL